jgi:predicted nucleic-acid-binding protein
MRAVDTNLLVRLFARDEEKQAERVDDFIEGGAWVSHLVLAETIWVFSAVYGATREHLLAGIESMMTHDRLTFEDANVVKAALANFRANTKVSFSDCLILEIARKAGHMPLGTFDKALGKLDGASTL